MADIAEVTNALEQVRQSYAKARAKHAPMHSAHEGYAVLAEEFDELWDEVKAWQPPGQYKPKPDCPTCAGKGSVWIGGQGGDYEDCHCILDTERESKANMRKEALHVAAMALAFILEVCDKDTPNGQ